MRSSLWQTAVCLAAAFGVTACGGVAPASQTTSSTGGQPGVPKLLIIGVQGEVITFVGGLGTTSGAANADPKARRMAHNNLTELDERDARFPLLATEVISTENGTWRVNPDGTMITTWTIRRGIKWHDGTPFTTDDLVFSFRIFQDPETNPSVGGSAIAKMASAQAPDPLTLEVHWSEIYFEADAALGLTPLPRHLLENLYQSDKAAFNNSSYFKHEFVGLGAFKLTKWEFGSYMELSRFDDYYLGRTLIDGVTMRFLSDPNTMVANILSGAVDVVLPLGVRVDDALELKQRWEGTGNRVVADLSGRLRHIEIQHRPEWAEPKDAMTNRLVRQGAYHATDRRSLIDLMNPGLNVPEADSWFSPHNVLRPRVESAIPRFPYNLTQAQQLLTQAGWIKDASGLLRHQSTGQPFRLLTWNTQSSGAEREMNAIAASWKVAGIEMEQYIVPSALLNDREARAKLAGVGITGSGVLPTVTRWQTKNSTAVENRWTGSNRGGYSNPTADALVDRLQVTIPADERVALHRQILQEMMGDVVIMPLFWDLDPILLLKHVRGVDSPTGSVNYNVLEWDRD